jgi:hypothetical protein
MSWRLREAFLERTVRDRISIHARLSALPGAPSSGSVPTCAHSQPRGRPAAPPIDRVARLETAVASAGDMNPTPAVGNTDDLARGTDRSTPRSAL